MPVFKKAPLLGVKFTSRVNAPQAALVCLISLYVFMSSAVLAETPLGRGNALTLNAAIKLTLSQNPSLNVFSLRDQSLAAQLDTAKQRPAYELGLDAENFSGTGPFNGAGSTEYTLSLSSIIELGGQRGRRGEVVSGHRVQLQAQREVAALDVLADVTRRFIDVLAAQKRVELAQESLNLAQDSTRMARQKAAAGATPDADVKRASAAAAQAKLVLASEQQQLDYLKVTLASSWGERQPQFAHAEGDLYQLGNTVDFLPLFARLERSPVIQVFAAQARIKDAEIRLAKAESSTNLRWSVGVRQFQESDDTALIAGFNVPLFSAKRNAGAITATRAEQAQIDINKELTLLSLHSQLYRLVNNRKQAALTVRILQKDVIPALQQALNETQTAYQRGRYRYVDYVSARQELISARRALIDSAATALKYDAEIEQLTAEPIVLD